MFLLSKTSNPLPTAVAVFPDDGVLRALAERHHHVVTYTEYDRGDHFAALQAPDLVKVLLVHLVPDIH